MLLRSITKHVKEQNWFAVFIDFLIVVVGVFIGIQVANWNQNQADKATAEQYLVRMQNELILNQEDMDLRKRYFEAMHFHAGRALQALEGPPERLDQDFFIDSWLASFSLGRPLVRTSYDELISAGTMNNIDDSATRLRIHQHYNAADPAIRFLNITPPYRDELRGALPYNIQAALRAAGCVANFGTDETTGKQTASINSECHTELALTPVQIAAAVERISAENFEFLLTQRMADLDAKLQLIDVVNKRSQILYEYLEETR